MQIAKKDIPKPKYGIGDTVIYDVKHLDYHDMSKKHRKVGVIEEAVIRLGKGIREIVYQMNDGTDLIPEVEILKLVLRADLEEPPTQEPASDQAEAAE